MAPKGQHTNSRHCFLFLGVTIVAVTLISIGVFRDQLLSAIQSLKLSGLSCSCPSATAAASIPTHHNHHGNEKDQMQPSIATTYKDLTILEELPPANVLWVNKTGGARPEAWGISMFHALHCIKMWQESLDPATMMNSHVHSESEYAEHASHCISYLLQSIVCAADSTIEPAEDIVMGSMHGRRIHGMGYQHQCRDTQFLFEMNGRTVDDWGWKQGDTLYSVFGGDN